MDFKERKLPPKITFQWHITDQCNLRCKHCYQDSYTDSGLPFSKLEKILNSLTNFVQTCRLENNTAKAHINFTGGEPFLRDDFLELLSKTRQKGFFSFAILSNGFLLPNDKLVSLKKLQPSFIQLSMEGSRHTHDYIRGNGSYKASLNAIKTYKKHLIPLMLSFTANSFNYREFSYVVSIGRRYNIKKVWTDRYLPKNSHDSLTLDTVQTKELFEIIQREKKKRAFFKKPITETGSDRALQFLVCGGVPYRCNAGSSLLTIMPDGKILPCRRLPLVIGDIFETDLVEMYKHNHVLQTIQSGCNAHGCISCHYYTRCNGGLKCLSYACTGDFTGKDRNCWI